MNAASLKLVAFKQESPKSAEVRRVWLRRGPALRASDKCGQATKSAWWMSRRVEAMKDAIGCDKPWGAVKRALIQGFPNGVTLFREPE